MFSDNTATTFKSTGLVLFSVHVDLMNVSPACRHKLVKNRWALLGFIPVITENVKIIMIYENLDKRLEHTGPQEKMK